MNKEPVIAGFTITAIITAVINLLVAFDVWEPTAEQIATLTTVLVIVASGIAAYVVRGRVSPVSTLPPPPPPPEP